MDVVDVTTTHQDYWTITKLLSDKRLHKSAALL